MERKIHYISAEHLTLDTVRAIIREGYELRLSDDAKARIIRCREYLDKKIATAEAPIYGVTTGFGSLCKVSIDEDKLSQLQINLMMSHACGEGDRVPTDVVRLIDLLQDPVALLRLQRHQARHRGASHRVLQPRRVPRCLSAG